MFEPVAKPEMNCLIEIISPAVKSSWNPGILSRISGGFPPLSDRHPITGVPGLQAVLARSLSIRRTSARLAGLIKGEIYVTGRGGRGLANVTAEVRPLP
jgi:hypothetical protein